MNFAAIFDFPEPLLPPEVLGLSSWSLPTAVKTFLIPCQNVEQLDEEELVLPTAPKTAAAKKVPEAKFVGKWCVAAAKRLEDFVQVRRDAMGSMEDAIPEEFEVMGFCDGIDPRILSHYMAVAKELRKERPQLAPLAPVPSSPYSPSFQDLCAGPWVVDPVAQQGSMRVLVFFAGADFPKLISSFHQLGGKLVDTNFNYTGGGRLHLSYDKSLGVTYLPNARDLSCAARPRAYAECGFLEQESGQRSEGSENDKRAEEERDAENKGTEAPSQTARLEAEATSATRSQKALLKAVEGLCEYYAAQGLCDITAQEIATALSIRGTTIHPKDRRLTEALRDSGLRERLQPGLLAKKGGQPMQTPPQAQIPSKKSRKGTPRKLALDSVG